MEKQKELMKRICGDIVLSENPGETMKKWRELFKIGQSELSSHLEISPSTISDYEANRRQSPGTKVVKRFVEALFEVDLSKGGKAIERLLTEGEGEDKYFELVEFSKAMDAEEFVKKIGGSIISNKQILKKKRVFGYTVIDSLNVILNVPYSLLNRIYGDTNERALIFTGVTSGRSPMVVVRTNPIKPCLVVFINLPEKDVDDLAIKISEKENIPIVITNQSVEHIKKAFSDD